MVMLYIFDSYNTSIKNVNNVYLHFYQHDLYKWYKGYNSLSILVFETHTGIDIPFVPLINLLVRNL